MPTTCKLIAKTILSASASSIEFTSIPSTYTDLLLVCSLRSDRASATFDFVKAEFNGSTSNLSCRYMYGNGSSAFSSTDTVAFIGIAAGSTATSSAFSNSEIYIPNYAGSTNKSISSSSANESNTATLNSLLVSAGLWSNTAAITSVKLIPNSGPNFVADSSAHLYGITKA